MSSYENLSHGTPDFPIGIHDTHCGDGFWLYPHIHREFEFLIMTQGAGTVFIDGQPFFISAGDGVFISSHSLHLGKKTDTSPCRFFAIVFAPEIFGGEGDLVSRSYIRPVTENKISFPTLYRPSVEWQKEVLDRALHIHAANREHLPLAELIIKEELFAIWRLCFAHGERASASQDPALRDMIKAMEFIRAEYASPITLKDIADSVNMSEGYFCRKFSDSMHISPFEYLLRIRIDNSCRLLQSTNLSISEAASACGFNSFSYFSKKFKEYVGKTPTAYRKKYNSAR